MKRIGGIAHPALVLALLLPAILSALSTGSAGERELVYVGTYTGKGSLGIYAFRFDPSTGAVDSPGLAAATVNPSFLASDRPGRFLYAVNEIDSFAGRPEGAVSVFSIDRASGALKFLQQVSSLGGTPAHLALDRSGRSLMVANYGGGSVAVFPIGPGGLLGARTAFAQALGSSVVKERQAAPHAHWIQTTPDNRLAVVADLGIDRLMVYRFDPEAGSLEADSSKSRSLKPGSGPRHVAMAPSGKFLFVVNELSSTVSAFAFDASRGSLEERQTVSTLPEAFAGVNTAAEIVLDPREKFLYVSNRGDDSIVVFGVGERDGELSLVQRVPSGGKTPRNFALDHSGRWLFCANQDSRNIALFRVGPDDGRLTPTPQSIEVDSPVCVIFVDE